MAASAGPRAARDSAGRASRRRPAHGRSARRPAVLWTAGIGLAVLAFYLWIYPVRGFRLALGSDTPVYIWWARRTGVLGFRSFLAGARPGTTGVLAALADILHTRVGTMVAPLQPVLAAAAGLAMGALVDLCLGRDRGRFALVSILTAAFLSLLVPGYLSTLAFGAMFLGALACLAAATGPGRGRVRVGSSDGATAGEGRGAVLGAGVLLGGAGLAHPLFLGFGAAILGGAMAGLVWRHARSRRGSAERATLRGSAVGSGALRVAVAGAIGAALTVAGLLAIGPAARHAVQTSRDSILRTVGLGSLSRTSYIRVLIRFFPWYRAAIVVLAAATVVLVLRRPRRGTSSDGPGATVGGGGPALFWGAMAAWMAVSIGGIVALFAGTSAPGQRMAAFCLALPAFAGVGLAAWWRRGGRWLAAVGVVLYLVVAGVFWERSQPLISSTMSLQLRAAGAALAAEPRGTTLVLVADDRTEHPAFSAPRNLNYLRDSVPTDRIQDVSIFFGSPADLLARRPSSTGIPEHDRAARWFWDQLRGSLRPEPRPLAVVLKAVDPESYASLFHLPQVRRHPLTYRIAPGVMTMPRYHGSAPTVLAAAGAAAFPQDAGTARFTPWTPAWLGPVVLLLLAAVGWPWSRAALPRTDPVAVAALAPAFGLAALALASMAVDAAGLRLASGGGLAALAVALVVGAVALVVLSGRARAGGPAAP